MSDWIDLSTLGKIILVSVICGAGLPALFAVGLRFLDHGDERPSSDDGAVVVTRNPVALTAAGLCFAIVLAAIGWGIYLIVAGT